MSSFQKQLFGLDKNGGYKVWSIAVQGNIILITHGKEGGKLQTKEESVYGKNLGRANETSDSQQAEFEAESRYKKQLDKGYREDKADLEELPLLPMLAADYHKQGHRIKYPCWASPKLDGVRSLAYWKGDKVVLLSRGGKEYSVPHLQEELSRLLPKNLILDGEIFIYGKYLEEITSAVKKPNELTPELRYVIFDIVNSDNFESRVADLLRMTLSELPEYLELIEYLVIEDEYEMKQQHKWYVEIGYEGIMLRNRDGLYESGKRSADLQKYKEFFDDEFEIIGVEEDRNGNAVFTVKNKFADNVFNVVGGSFDERKKFLEDRDNYVGKWITIKYQTLYKDTSIPQFPVMIGFRDVSTSGDALE
jgi:DNA ligase-1